MQSPDLRFCSQCGEGFGRLLTHRDASVWGYSHCEDHASQQPLDDPEAWLEGQMDSERAAELRHDGGR